MARPEGAVGKVAATASPRRPSRQRTAMSWPPWESTTVAVPPRTAGRATPPPVRRAGPAHRRRPVGDRHPGDADPAGRGAGAGGGAVAPLPGAAGRAVLAELVHQPPAGRQPARLQGDRGEPPPAARVAVDHRPAGQLVVQGHGQGADEPQVGAGLLGAERDPRAVGPDGHHHPVRLGADLGGVADPARVRRVGVRVGAGPAHHHPPRVGVQAAGVPGHRPVADPVGGGGGRGGGRRRPWPVGGGAAGQAAGGQDGGQQPGDAHQTSSPRPHHGPEPVTGSRVVVCCKGHPTRALERERWD
jgi:hypothetical protein